MKLRWAVYKDDPENQSMTWRVVRRGWWEFVITHDAADGSIIASYVDLRDPKEQRVLHAFKDEETISLPAEVPERFSFSSIDAADAACNAKFWQLKKLNERRK
jgi:hypothetical protein